MNNDQIREIREIAIDFRGDGREEGAYAVDVLDQAVPSSIASSSTRSRSGAGTRTSAASSRSSIRSSRRQGASTFHGRGLSYPDLASRTSSRRFRSGKKSSCMRPIPTWPSGSREASTSSRPGTPSNCAARRSRSTHSGRRGMGRERARSSGCPSGLGPISPPTAS